jgi:hypothetical protein
MAYGVDAAFRDTVVDQFINDVLRMLFIGEQ